jgi:NAD(P)-dependent dehydrogenase (short-subunit alcohol dehydrogenase family)
MLLEKKNAIIYGGGGSLGAAVAAAYAGEGARVFLAGRTREPLDAAAAAVRDGGGAADVAVLDATDERAVDAHAAAVVAEAGSIDISFNLVTRGDAQGTPLVEMTLADLRRAVDVGLTSTFLTARAAVRQMAAQGAGVILSLTSGTAKVAAPMMGSTGPADAAVESFLRCLAAEVGPAGVRVVGIHTAGVVETLDVETMRAVNPGIDVDGVVAGISAMTMLKRAPRLADVVGTATFLASDAAAGITGTIVNTSCGLIPG